MTSLLSRDLEKEFKIRSHSNNHLELVKKGGKGRLKNPI